MTRRGSCERLAGWLVETGLKLRSWGSGDRAVFKGNQVYGSKSKRRL